MSDAPGRPAAGRWSGFLAVSCGPDAPASLRQPVAAALGALTAATDAATDGRTQDRTVMLSPIGSGDAGRDGWVAASGAGIDERAAADGAFTIGLGRLLRGVDGERSAAELAGAVTTASADLARLLPPFAVAHRRAAGEAIHVAVDWLGFFQLYVWQGTGVAAVSTSARALAALAGGGFDDTALGVQAMIGWQPGDATIFAGVRAVPAATVVSLQHGVLRTEQYVAPLSFARSDAPAPLLADAVDEMASILRGALERSVVDHPDALLQLTGGHDSRILLGAVAPANRRGLHALTLGDGSSRDVSIAADLCRRYGMVHQVHPVDGQAWPSPAGVHQLVLDSSRALECLASPLALAPLLLAERDIVQGHRLSGLGGEVARGFYYAGQPRGASTSPSAVTRLAQWRLCSNEAVEAEALDPAFRDSARSTTMGLLTTLFAAGDWLRATDEFYLYQRMRRWGGAHGTVATMRRESVNAMFDRRFLELALAVAPADKRDSLLLGRLMTRLDPELAAIPLDIGLVPAQLGERTLRTKAVVSMSSARRTARKAWQRARRGRRPQVGAAHAGTLLLEHWRQVPSVCEPLESVPGIDRAWLRGLLAGAHDAQPTTLAFLANVLAATTPAERTGQQESGT